MLIFNQTPKITLDVFKLGINEAIAKLSLTYIPKITMQRLREAFIQDVAVNEAFSKVLLKLLIIVNAQSNDFRRNFMQGLEKAVLGLNYVKCNQGLPLVVANYVDRDELPLDIICNRFRGYLLAQLNTHLVNCKGGGVKERIAQYKQACVETRAGADIKVRFSSKVSVRKI